MYSSNIDIKLSGRDALSYVKLVYTLYVVLNCPNVDIKVSAHDGIIFITYAQCQNIWKPNKIKIFGSKKNKGTKQDI